MTKGQTNCECTVQYILKRRCCSERFKSFTIRQHDPKVIFILSLHRFVLYSPFRICMCACGCEVKQPQMEKTRSPLFIMKKIAPFWKVWSKDKSHWRSAWASVQVSLYIWFYMKSISLSPSHWIIRKGSAESDLYLSNRVLLSVFISISFIRPE